MNHQTAYIKCICYTCCAFLRLLCLFFLSLDKPRCSLFHNEPPYCLYKPFVTLVALYFHPSLKIFLPYNLYKHLKVLCSYSEESLVTLVTVLHRNENAPLRISALFLCIICFFVHCSAFHQHALRSQKAQPRYGIFRSIQK